MKRYEDNSKLQGEEMKGKNKKDDINVIKNKLEPFLKNNPFSSIKGEDKNYVISNPWGDDTISFLLIKENKSEMINALNNVILPPRFTALYHLDSNTMEYIYTPIKKDNPCASREFKFILDGKTYNCQFKYSSERLITFSKSFIPVEEESSSSYRNLWSYTMYFFPKLRERFKMKEEFFKNRIPISFFVSGFEKFEEDSIIEVSKHLNFYITYYDRESPIIVIHSSKTESSDATKELQLIGKKFPEKISSNQKDSFLLDLCLAAREAQTRLSFLYYYQILEYAAFYYLDIEIKQKMKKIIVSPDIHTYPDKYINSIVEIITSYRETDDIKINKIVDICCSPDIVWNEMLENLSYFTSKQKFDGGFSFEPFVSEDMTLESFSAMWIPKTPVTLRKIRNALVHARESRLGSVISPSLGNDLLLKPWIPIIRRVAEQVLISC